MEPPGSSELPPRVLVTTALMTSQKLKLMTPQVMSNSSCMMLSFAISPHSITSIATAHLIAPFAVVLGLMTIGAPLKLLINTELQKVLNKG